MRNDNGYQVLVIDAAVEEAAHLLLGLDPSVTVVRLEPGEDRGLAAVLDALAGLDDIASLHILSHGGEGSLTLGGQVLDGASLSAATADLKALGAKLSSGGDLLLYGCSVASGDGRAFVDALAAITGRDVAASDDLTGAAM